MIRVLPFYLLFIPLTLFFAIVAIITSFFDSTGNIANRVSLFWGGLICALAGVKVQADRKNFDPAGKYILMANHKSWFDIPVLLVAFKGHQFRFVAKESLFKIPFFGHAMTRVGYIGIDRANPRRGMKSIQEAITKASHASILIFPEGTRCEKLGDFKIGGMILAIKSERPIIPVLIAGTDMILPKGSLLIRPGTAAVRLLPPVATRNSYTLKEREKLKTDMRQLMDEHLKETETWLDTMRR